MALVVDDILGLPVKIGEIVFNSIVQTAYKVSWVKYQGELRNKLIQARYDWEKGKLSEKQFKEIEAHIFKEMKVARKVVASSEERK